MSVIVFIDYIGLVVIVRENNEWGCYKCSSIRGKK